MAGLISNRSSKLEWKKPNASVLNLRCNEIKSTSAKKTEALANQIVTSLPGRSRRESMKPVPQSKASAAEIHQALQIRPDHREDGHQGDLLAADSGHFHLGGADQVRRPRPSL